MKNPTSLDYIRDLDTLEFVIFCIENLAIRLQKDAQTVYCALYESGILAGYIASNYETLHTQGKDYILEDILSLIQEEGVSI